MDLSLIYVNMELSLFFLIVSTSNLYSAPLAKNNRWSCAMSPLTCCRKGDRILSVGKLLVRKDGKVRLGEDYSLELTQVEEADAGQYSCPLDVYGHTQTLLHNLTVLGKV